MTKTTCLQTKSSFLTVLEFNARRSSSKASLADLRLASICLRDSRCPSSELDCGLMSPLGVFDSSSSIPEELKTRDLRKFAYDLRLLAEWPASVTLLLLRSREDGIGSWVNLSCPSLRPSVVLSQSRFCALAKLDS